VPGAVEAGTEGTGNRSAVIYSAREYATMSLLKRIFIFLRRCILGLLLGYWGIFISYTVIKLFEGGPGRVVAWYKHIGQPPLQWNGTAFVLHAWKWERFLTQQAVLVTITLLLCIFEWIASRTRKLGTGG
jgi:hypothetical protein